MKNKLKYSMTEHRYGYLKYTKEFLKDVIILDINLFNNIIPLDVTYDEMTETYTMLATSKMFGDVKDGDVIPEYTFRITKAIEQSLYDIRVELK